MDEFIKMDTFFFIASIGTIILSVLLILIVIYVVIILRKINKIVEEAKKLAEIISEEGGKTAELIREKTEDVVSGNNLTKKFLTTILSAVISQIINKKTKRK